MNFKNALLATALVAASALAAPTVMAQPFDISTSGSWIATVPSPPVNFSHTTPAPVPPPTNYAFPPNGTVTGSDQINWGNPILPDPNNPNGLNSGYRYVPINTTGIANLTDPAGFVIGQFTHFNFTIGDGESITQATLALTVNITEQGGGPPTPVVFNFVFTHNETPNFPVAPGQPCPSTPSILLGSGLAVNGCPDVVGLQSAFGDQVVDINGQLKTLHILGFLLDADNNGVADGPTLVSQFITAEATDNHALLLVTFSNPPNGIPEPAGIGLLGLGALGLGWMGYRRRKTA
jgi:hypothetical protein